jgi:RNA polymerase sigma-70 factor (ECF subfamily)
LRTWIYGIALRVVSGYRQRAHRRHEKLVGEPPETVTDAEQVEVLERQRDWALLDRMLSGLPEEQRQVFVLYEVDELTMREICEVIGCPLQTAYSRLHVARKRIASTLAELRAQESP